MVVYRIVKDEYADDLTGNGAYLYGGRWNSARKYALYTSAYRSLAVLELLVHTQFEILSSNKFTIMTLQLPKIKDLKKIPTLENSKLIGDELLSKMVDCYFEVPSVIITEEKNIIINPLHILAKNIKIIDKKPFVIDSRFK